MRVLLSCANGVCSHCVTSSKIMRGRCTVNVRRMYCYCAIAARCNCVAILEWMYEPRGSTITRLHERMHMRLRERMHKCLHEHLVERLLHESLPAQAPTQAPA